MTTPPKGTLYLVPTPLDFGCDTSAPIADVLPQATLRVASGLTHWITENAKSTRAFLKRVDAVLPLAMPLQHMHWQELTLSS
jgi:16S rRNA (cytidine1402-2'-O)-methyltransferase